MLYNKERLSMQRYAKDVSDLLKNEDVKKMNDYIQHSDITTLYHCIHVSYISYLICSKCRFFGFNSINAARGGLLHDMFLYDWHKDSGSERSIRGLIAIKKWRFLSCMKCLHGFSHPEVALENARTSVEINNCEADIILNHMWPLTIYRLPRYKETYVVTIADKLCTVMEVLNIYPGSFSKLDEILKQKTSHH